MKSLETVLPSLADATRNQKLDWSEGEGRRESQLICNITKKLSVAVWSWFDPDSETHGLSAELLRDSKVIDVVQAADHLPLYAVLSDLHDEARRSVNDVGAAVDEIERALAFRI